MMTLAKTFFNSAIWSAKWFPSLKEEGISFHPVDLRCGFSKAFMQGKLEDTHVTQVWFKDDNIIKWQSHFGCGLVYYDTKIAKELGIKEANIFKSSSEAWVNHRSFFISSEGFTQFDFSDNRYTRKSLV